MHPVHYGIPQLSGIHSLRYYIVYILIVKVSQHGIEIDKKKIQLDAPIKQTGELEVGLKLYYEVNARLKVIVEAE